MEDENGVIFKQLEENLPCQGMDAEIANGTWAKPDPS
jgi:hypothetical protein